MYGTEEQVIKKKDKMQLIATEIDFLRRFCRKTILDKEPIRTVRHQQNNKMLIEIMEVNWEVIGGYW